MKTICMIAGAIAGLSTSLLALWELTSIDSAAVIFWSLIVSLFCSMVFGSAAEEAKKREIEKMRKRRKYQTYDINYRY